MVVAARRHSLVALAPHKRRKRLGRQAKLQSRRLLSAHRGLEYWTIGADLRLQKDETIDKAAQRQLEKEKEHWRKVSDIDNDAKSSSEAKGH
ncbi:hypothetical protein E2562_028782 [Oryza meyeriana var. granulata]|uniref:Uncharacterized protein n=1 Tax=Oryza meyeriana var. granulata TaxID=110450 RepID=A0A6G1FD15_9ORYZ|nr:hypothetical protein E2562_028782 [Oryza meyeriana var. granulata]